MMKIVFLVSGSGGNLKFFFQCIRLGLLKDVELAVVADRDCPAIDFARTRGLISEQIAYSRSQPDALRQVLQRMKPDIVVTNWNKIIDKDTVEEYSGKMINLHYSLLPAFSGLIGIEPIKQAYSKGCYYIGPTCHSVDAEVDAGKIIFQSAFRADMPIEAAIGRMFREGCVSLVFSIWILTRGNLNVQAALICRDEPARAEVAVKNLGGEFWKEIELL